MEALTRLVSDSLARHGLDRPVDPRRLQWSRWFRCDSPHSLLVVPSKPGIFALAEDILPSQEPLGGAALQRCDSSDSLGAASAAEVISKRMLAVIQFSEDDNMAYVLDRMFTWVNPLRSRLHSGNCFVRFVVVEDQQQRRSICSALNQWMRNSAEKATGLPSDFYSSMELTTASVTPGRVSTDRVGTVRVGAGDPPAQTLQSTLDYGAGKNLHCPQPFPSGF